MRDSLHLFTSVILYSSVFITIKSSKDCLSDVSITEINSEQANLTWNFDCKENEIRSFKIFYDHIDYKACSGKDYEEEGEEEYEDVNNDTTIA